MWFWVTAQGTFHQSLKDSLQYSLWGRFAGEFSHFLCTWKCLNFSFISEGGFRQRIVGWKPFLSALWRHHPTVVWLPWFLMRSQQFILLISLLTDNVQFVVKIWLNIQILKFIDFSHFAHIFLVQRESGFMEVLTVVEKKRLRMVDSSACPASSLPLHTSTCFLTLHSTFRVFCISVQWTLTHLGFSEILPHWPAPLRSLACLTSHQNRRRWNKSLKMR